MFDLANANCMQTVCKHNQHAKTQSLTLDCPAGGLLAAVLRQPAPPSGQ